MSLLLSQLSKLPLVEPALLRRSCFSLLSNGFSSFVLQTPACSIARAEPCGEDLGRLVIRVDKEFCDTYMEKKVPLELMNGMVTVGASHGWVATLKEDGIVRLQDDLNPLEEQGKAVYTQDIGDLNIFISKSEAFCDSATDKPSNFAELLDFDEMTTIIRVQGFYLGHISVYNS
ncbi:unnamed protein product [Eruca vesicaria subsp. sativa]|uniref:Uncharacterized protein n=1 Tax=Eruca vesicaria subsp. sativa TaxID=29727 RepID=A0ABC8KHM6_ERUVS|nr:unnamed protein product [Eruca vesicaria subsp. sativa]